MIAADVARTFGGRKTGLAALVTSAAVLFAAIPVLPLLQPGTFSTHMALHIALMNCVAPLMAMATLSLSATKARVLWFSTVLQMLLLWAWHAPAVQGSLIHSGAHALAMHVSLFAAALLFWSALLRLSADARWNGVAALLVTGKLACLLAALFVFAPAPLFAGHHGAPVTLADQQLAGLLMITACPLSYVLAGVVLAAQILNDTVRGAARRTAAR